MIERCRWSIFLRTLVPTLLILLLIVLPPPVRASRSEIYARSIPSSLAIDEWTIEAFPATVAAMDPIATADHASYGSFVLGIAGSGNARLGYLNDNGRQGLFLGLAGRVGLLATVDGGGTESISETVQASDAGIASVKETRRSGSLSLGSLLGGDEDRRTEWSLEGSRSEIDDTRRNTDGSERSTESGGNTVTARLRSLALRSGLLGSIRLTYAETDLDYAGDGLDAAGLSVDRSADVRLGWRIPVRQLDDLVAGAGLVFGSADRSQANTQGVPIVSELRSQSASLFVSMEKAVVSNLRVRGGTSTSWSHNLSRQRLTGSAPRFIEYETSGFESPSITLGVGWTWKRVDFDAYLNRNIRLDVPVVTWAVSTPL